MSFKQKIDMILEAKKLERLTKNKIERLIGVDGTIYKAYDDDREPADSEIVRKLIGTLGIRQEWWNKEWESGSKDIFITHADKRSDNKEKAEISLEDTIEALIAELRENNKYLRNENKALAEFNERLRADLRNVTDQSLQLASAALTNGKKQ